MSRLPVHVLYCYDGPIFSTHCNERMTFSQVDEGTAKLEVIEAGSTRQEIRKVTCKACMTAYLPRIVDGGWRDYDKIREEFGKKLAQG